MREAVSAAGAVFGFRAVGAGFAAGRCVLVILVERIQRVAVTVAAGSRLIRLAGERSRGGGRAGVTCGVVAG